LRDQAMKNEKSCPKCDSTDIIVDAKAVDQGHGNQDLDLQVATYRKPQALVFKGKQMTTLSAWVCGRCGYVEFYADDPAALKIQSNGLE
jgi:predicted nucleic-acid-binding Zn-ribbon protein